MILSVGTFVTEFDFYHLIAVKEFTSLMHALFMQLVWWCCSVGAFNYETVLLLVQFGCIKYILKLWWSLIYCVHSDIPITSSIPFNMFVSKCPQHLQNFYVVLTCKALIWCLSWTHHLFRWLQERATQSAWISFVREKKKIAKRLS